MMKSGFLLSAALVLAGCTPDATVSPAPPAKAAPLIIRNDDGGNVTGYIARRNQLAASGRRVEFHGYCASACTLLVTIPNACLAPDARLGFHAPHFIGSGKPAPILNPLMARYYRGGVLAKWTAVWSKSTQMQMISARDYVRLDPETKLCR